ncbi:MAG: Sulfate/thiosulfate import ATP-binding protein CysA [candidate division WS2 bacterium]|nr:Sulfate/thiosulfate import ATP-binding protein CysA [Candidatus Psychracetigena formicireducens]
MSLVAVSNLGKKIQERWILKDINLKVERGKISAIFGPTGAGKTTLLRIIGLLDKPTAGLVTINDLEVKPGIDNSLLRRKISMVLQKPVVFNSSVWENVAYGLRIRGLSYDLIKERVDTILNNFGLEKYAWLNARKLSGGEMQKVALARAMVVKPEILILDEPTANLDIKTSGEVEEKIKDYVYSGKGTIIMSTHDLQQGQRLADHISVMHNGTITQYGDKGEIFYHPQTIEVARFIGFDNILTGTIVDRVNDLSLVKISEHSLEVISNEPIGSEVNICLRPEDITISINKPAGSARNTYLCEIKRVSYLNPLARIELDGNIPLICLITSSSARDLQLTSGKQVFASIKTTAIRVIPKKISI